MSKGIVSYYGKRFVAIMLVSVVMLATGCTEKEDVDKDWVDLDLPSGLLWATRNVGASFPNEGYGYLFAWGETTRKEVYDWSTYRYCNGDLYQLTKYCYNSEYGYNGFTDNLTILQSGDDAATANYGGRTPTIEEWQELVNNSTIYETVQNGVRGLLFIGTNDNSLFLPTGYYWSSSLCMWYPAPAWSFSIEPDHQGMCRDYRCYARSVRAVRSAR